MFQLYQLYFLNSFDLSTFKTNNVSNKRRMLNKCSNQLLNYS